MRNSTILLLLVFLFQALRVSSFQIKSYTIKVGSANKISPKLEVKDNFYDATLLRTFSTYQLITKNSTVNLVNIPDVRQAEDYTCGPSSLQAVLMYYGLEYREGELAQMTNADPEDGTSVDNMVRVIKQLGLRPISKTNMNMTELQAYINRKVPVIVLIQAWRDQDNLTPWVDDWEDGHYVVVIGYDQKNLYFEDPSILGGIGYIPRAEFLERWHDVDTNTEEGTYVVYRQFGIAVQGRFEDLETILYIQ